MPDLRYEAPQTLGDALNILNEYGDLCAIYAGGTDLMPRLAQGGQRPQVFLYIGHLGLSSIQRRENTLAIGATCAWRDLADSEVVAREASALAAAISCSSTPAVKNKATLGGNLANASPAADLATPLLALDAEVVLVSLTGQRVVALTDFFKGPGQTAMKPTELLVEIRVPLRRGNTEFLKLGWRQALTCSVANVAVRVLLEGKRITEARIALGAMAPTPMRSTAAEQMLVGQVPDEKLLKEVATCAMERCRPIDDVRASAWYRRKACGALLIRALEHVLNPQRSPER